MHLKLLHTYLKTYYSQIGQEWLSAPLLRLCLHSIVLSTDRCHQSERICEGVLYNFCLNTSNSSCDMLHELQATIEMDIDAIEKVIH